MIIGTRILKIHRQPGPVGVAVRLHAPEPEASSWICRYEIDWPEGRRESFAAGLDPIQALSLMLQKIGAELYTSRHHASGQLAWGEPGSGYGFPVPKGLRDMLIGDDQSFEG